MIKPFALICALGLAAVSAPPPGHAQGNLPPAATSPCIIAPTTDQMRHFVGEPLERARGYVDECDDLDQGTEYVFEEASACLPVGHIIAVRLTSPPNLIARVTFVVSNERLAPDLVQKEYQEARRILKDCQLDGEFLPSALLEDGQIVSTAPTAGSPLRAEDEMIAWTVRGTAVPDVVGMGYDLAIEALTAAHFEIGERIQQKINLAEWQRQRRWPCGFTSGTRGNVVVTSPLAGTFVPFAPANGQGRAKVSITYESAPVWNSLAHECNEHGIQY